MNVNDLPAITSQIALGLCLASVAGLRAFLPLLVVGVLAHLGVVHLNEAFEWLGSPAAIAVLAVSVVADFLADKIPLIDHALDIIHTVIRPAAGVVAIAGTQAHLGSHAAELMGLALGIPIAGGVHMLKSGTRVASTAMSAGLLSPVISFAEDFSAVVVCVLAVFAPFVTLAIICLGIAALVTLLKRVRRSNYFLPREHWRHVVVRFVSGFLKRYEGPERPG